MMSGRRDLLIATAVAAASVVLSVPTAASAGLGGDLLDDVRGTVNGLTGGGGGSGGGGPAAPVPAPAPAPTPLATTTPPLSSDDPHGTGTVLDADADTPLTPGTDDVVVGRSDGRQDGSGSYHGQVTIVSALGMDVSVSTDEGETQESPLTPINDALDDVCTGSGNNVCLTALDYRSETTGDGSENSFEAASASVGNGTADASVLRSEGNVEESGACQTAHGESSAADVGAFGQLDADVLSSSSDSEACRDGSKSTDADSSVANLNGTGLLSALGCDEDQVDDEFEVPLLVEGVCNGDDTNGAQAAAPYNVRKALQLEILGSLNPRGAGGLVNLNAGSSESLARAPGPECPDPANPACDEPGSGVDPDNGGGATSPAGGGPGGPGGPSADQAAKASLPFTGADLLWLALIGGGVMAAGLAAMALADRRRATNQV